MSYLQEYIDKLRSKDINSLMRDQGRLAKKFNEKYNYYLFVYSSCIEKNIPEGSLSMEDYEVIHDLLLGVSGKRVLFYLETMGGSGDAARDIAMLLHDKFDEVHFLIAGQAKSAGTILALSGDEIFMTETGALGPIDAQMKLGRTMVSAHGYLEWVEQTRKEAIENKKLNPFDATMVAQISPGELSHAYNSLHFAINLVKEWLPKYKFKNWTKTESRCLVVTDKMKAEQAEKIATDLTDQSRWHSHGRSLKIKDLNALGLQIHAVEDNQNMLESVYRIKAINRMIFGSSPAYKIFLTETNRIQKNAMPKEGTPLPRVIDIKKADIVEFDFDCNKCHKKHIRYLKFKKDPKIDKEMKQKGIKPFPKKKTIKCSCGNILDLIGPLNDLESKIGEKAII